MNNVTNGTVYKAESMEDLMRVLNETGVGNAVGSNQYCREICADNKKFEAPEDNSIIAKQGTRFNWLNQKGHILTLETERNCKVIFDSKTWKKDYDAAVKKVSDINSKLRNDESYESCSDEETYNGNKACVNRISGNITRRLSCDSNYEYDRDHSRGIVCKMTSSYKSELKSQRAEAIKSANDLISDANGCYNRVSPDYKPCDDVEVSYGDEVYGPILDADKDAKRLVRTGGSGLTRNSMDTKTIYITKINSCGDSSCSISSVQINLLKAKTLTYKGNYAWDLHDDLFMCVGIDGYSYLRCEIAENKLSGSNSYFGKYKNFIKLDSSNFPVNFNSAPTVHDIKIDYKTGESEYTVPTTKEEPKVESKVESKAESKAESHYEDPEESPKNENTDTHTYILNTNTKKFHYPDCSAVKRMKDSNKEEFTGTRDEVISRGYDPCQKCFP